jgi:hypothetical protein
VSGIIRYTKACDSFELSLDGGITFSKFDNSDPTTTLDDAYNEGPNIILTDKFGNIEFTGENRKVIFTTVSTQPHLRVSGLIPMPKGTHNVGDITMLRHSISSGTPLPPAQQQETTVAARSLGIGTLVLDTGSGIANISVGSGIAQFYLADTVTVELPPILPGPYSGTLIPMNRTDIWDRNYEKGNLGALGSPPVIAKGFIIWSPGLYRCSYTISYDRSAGTARRMIKTTVRRNTHEILDIGDSYSYHRSSAGAGEGTCHATFLFEANAGDTITFNAEYVGTTTNPGDAIATIPDECWCTVEKIGSRRHEAVVEGV